MNKFIRTLDRIPTMGVGFGFNFDLPLTPHEVSRLREGDLGGFDYIEVQPPHVLLFHDMWRVIEAAPTIIHCSQFSLASLEPKQDARFTRLTKEVMVRAKTPWFAEHISLSQFPGGDTKHFFLPYLDGSIAANVIRNATELQRLMGYPMLLENAPRFFDVTREPINEAVFLSEVVNECDCGYLLDLSSARKTCMCLGYSLEKYVAKMPLDVLVEMHVGDIAIENVLAMELIRDCPVKGVTLEANLSKAADAELRHFAESVNNELKKKSKRSRVSIAELTSADGKTECVCPLSADMLSRAHFSQRTSILICDDHFEIHSPGMDTTFVPHAAANVISDILVGKPLKSMLDISNPDIGVYLMILSKHARPNDNSERSAWKDWGLAEAFHRSIRSSVLTTFEGKEAFEARLSTPESQAARPVFTKEYPLHPFFRLPPPGDLLNDSMAGVLLTRRTCREFRRGNISLERISNILYYSCGWTASGSQRVGGMPIIRKTSPSPGSMASIEAYLIVLDVAGLFPGIYHYSMVSHCLELLNGENPSNWFVEACGDQSWVANCSAGILLCGVTSRLAWKYPMPKAYEAMLMEVGHVSQTALLCCTAEELQCFCTAALREGMFEERIDLQPLEDVPLMLIGIGCGEIPRV